MQGSRGNSGGGSMYEAAFASSSQRAEDGGACSQSTRAARFAPSLVAQCDLLPRTSKFPSTRTYCMGMFYAYTYTMRRVTHRRASPCRRAATLSISGSRRLTAGSRPAHGTNGPSPFVFLPHPIHITMVPIILHVPNREGRERSTKISASLPLSASPLPSTAIAHT